MIRLRHSSSLDNRSTVPLSNCSSIGRATQDNFVTRFITINSYGYFAELHTIKVLFVFSLFLWSGLVEIGTFLLPLVSVARGGCLACVRPFRAGKHPPSGRLSDRSGRPRLLFPALPPVALTPASLLFGFRILLIMAVRSSHCQPACRFCSSFPFHPLWPCQASQRLTMAQCFSVRERNCSTLDSNSRCQ